MDKNDVKVKARLLKFGSKTCGACIAMDRSRVLERFASENPDVSIVKLDVSDEEGESPPAKALGDVDYKQNYALSDEYEVESLPTLILEVEGTGELARIEGAANVKQLRELTGVLEDFKEAVAVSRRLPWT